MAKNYFLLRDGDEVRVKFSYSTAPVEAIKTLPVYARSWDKEERTWIIDADFLEELEELFESIGMVCGNPEEQAHRPQSNQNTRNGHNNRNNQNGSASHYDVLWLKPGAPQCVIDAAYKALIRQNHPDIGGDPQVATAINVAYHNLKQKS